MRVAVTRPAPQSEATARKLAAAGHSPILAPLMVFRPLPASLDTGGAAGVLVTSRNAIAALEGAGSDARDGLVSLPLLAVGDATAVAARSAGFGEVVSADGDAADLAALAARRWPPGSLLIHLAGEDRAADLGALLAAAGIEVEPRIMYRMDAVEMLPVPLASAARNGELDAVLLYSPRTAAIYVERGRASDVWSELSKIVHLTLSTTVAAPLEKAGIEQVCVSPAPREDAILALVGSLAQTIPESAGNDGGGTE